MDNNNKTMAKRMKDGQWLKSDAVLLQDLANRVQNLPQELYDEIEALVFSMPPPGCWVYITSHWRPPVATQVSRTISEKFAEGYWQKPAFVMNQHDLDQWSKTASTDGIHLRVIDEWRDLNLAVAKWVGR